MAVGDISVEVIPDYKPLIKMFEGLADTFTDMADIANEFASRMENLNG